MNVCGDQRLAVVLLSFWLSVFDCVVFQHCCAQIDLSFVELRKNSESRRTGFCFVFSSLSSDTFIRSQLSVEQLDVSSVEPWSTAVACVAREQVSSSAG